MQSSQSANGFPTKNFEQAFCLGFVAYCNLFTLSSFGISIIVIVTTNALEVTEGWTIPAVHNLSLYTSCSTTHIDIPYTWNSSWYVNFTDFAVSIAAVKIYSVKFLPPRGIHYLRVRNM